MQILDSTAETIIGLPRSAKRAVAITLDVALCFICSALAYRLRLDAWIIPIGSQWLSYLLSAAIAIPIFVRLGLYRAIFRYVGWHALATIVWACAIYSVFYVIIFAVVGIPNVPRATGLLQPVLLFLAIAASRAVARLWLGGGYLALLTDRSNRRILIYGAGAAGRQLAAGLSNSSEFGVIGFIDDNRSMWGSYLNGKPIYSPAALPELVDDLAITDILLAIPSASRKQRNEIVDSLRGHRVEIRTLPGIAELAGGKVTVSDLRPLLIEDLLGRDPIPPNNELLKKSIEDKVVLVTGAGGSIGSELCRQIVRQRPKHIILLDNGEFNLYQIDQELKKYSSISSAEINITSCLTSVTDLSRISTIFEMFRPDTTFHAAAYKHVPLVEANPVAAVLNNVLGTKIVAEQAVKHGCGNFVLISTDKAVRPTNVMGATKRLAEILLQSLARTNSDTCLSMVRFGNVLGSSGSVVPLFRSQIANGGPVTVTHENVTRYFMTIPEAAQLVIQASAMAEGGDVFVLDMGEPVRIMDLARRMIELSGLSVRSVDGLTGDISITVTGLRPGEKLYEELLLGNQPSPTQHPLIMRASEPVLDSKNLQKALKNLQKALNECNSEELISILQDVVPEFKHKK